MKVISIGAWDFPSGNQVGVSLGPQNGTAVRRVRCEWLRWPPSKRDQKHYREVVAPAIMARLREYLEVAHRPALYVQVEE